MENYSVGQRVKVMAGNGYFRLDFFPLGGDFHRAVNDLLGVITRDYHADRITVKSAKSLHGCNYEILLDSGEKIATGAANIQAQD